MPRGPLPSVRSSVGERDGERCSGYERVKCVKLDSGKLNENVLGELRVK